MATERGGRHESDRDEPIEIAVVGELHDCESDITGRLLDAPPGSRCVLYFDSPGGSSYSALSLFTLIRLRNLDATGVVTGECSSAALWPFAACAQRYVTPFSLLLFHPMKWQSDEHVGRNEATEWARYFARLEPEMDRLLAELFGADPLVIDEWTRAHRHVSGLEMAAAGLATLIDPRKERLNFQPPKKTTRRGG